MQRGHSPNARKSVPVACTDAENVGIQTGSVKGMRALQSAWDPSCNAMQTCNAALQLNATLQRKVVTAIAAGAGRFSLPAPLGHAIVSLTTISLISPLSESQPWTP